MSNIPRGQKHWAPALKVAQQTLVEYLKEGYGYDRKSVEEAISRGNDHFVRGSFHAAAELFGVAYELARLYLVYPALMYDLLVWRALCHSFHGEYSTALLELDLSLQLIPNVATAHLMKGIVFSMLGHAGEATTELQYATTLNEHLMDLANCFAALFSLARGHANRAIEICSDTLDRSPQSVFALLVRGDAYALHSSTCYTQQAAKDYAAAFAHDDSLQCLSAKQLGVINAFGYTRVCKLLLHFHPHLRSEPPRSYAEYPTFTGRFSVFRAALVMTAVAKLRVSVRSTRTIRSVQQQRGELLHQRASAEQRLERLLEKQRRLTKETRREVWGPADPALLHAHKYRRYWLEIPDDFPLRHSPRRETSLSPERALGMRRRPLTPERARGQPTQVEHEIGANITFGHADFCNSIGPSDHRSMDLLQANFPPRRETEPASRSTDPVSPNRVVNNAGSQKKASASSSNDAASLKRNIPQVTPPEIEPLLLPSPPVKIGQSWEEAQWLDKAYELSEFFTCSVTPNSSIACDLDSTPLSSWPRIEQLNIKEGTHEPAVFQKLPKHAKSFGIMDLVKAMTQDGVVALPEWYSALDRIYEITNLAPFAAQPPPFAAAASYTGAPGHSYVVPPKTLGGGRGRGRGARPGSAATPADGGEGGAQVAAPASEVEVTPGSEDASQSDLATTIDPRSSTREWPTLDEETVRRYQNRLLATTLSGASAGRT